MTAMFVGFGLYFFYDGFIGYPKKNKRFLAHQKFEERDERKKAFEEEGGVESEWAAIAEGEGFPEGTWEDFATEQGWPEKPPEKLYSTTDQFVCGGLCVGVGLFILGTMFLNRRRKVTADADSFTTPKGESVPFASAFRVDKRKWDNKGLAYVYYRDEADKERRAVIDDLKFDGADKILDRLMDNFEGELIERIAQEPASGASGGVADGIEEDHSHDDPASDHDSKGKRKAQDEEVGEE